MTVSQSTVIQNLKHYIKHIWVSLFDFIKKYNAIRITTYCISQLSTALIAYISWRRTNHTRYTMLLHVFAHIQTNQVILTSTELITKSLAQFSLAYTRGSDEQKGTDRLVMGAESNFTTLDCIRYALNRIILTNHRFFKLILKFRQFLKFIQRQITYLDVCNSCNYITDFVLSHNKLFTRILCTSLHMSTSLIYDSQSLVRLFLIRHITTTQFYSVFDHFMRYQSMMVFLINSYCFIQNLNCIIIARLVYHNSFKASIESFIRFNRFAIFFSSRSSNYRYSTSCQHRL